MNNISHLLHRAKAKNSNQYAIGWFFKTSKQSYIIPISPSFYYIEVEESTLAVHHPSMLDSNNNKIFASLQEDGQGGDIDQNGKVFIFNPVETIPYFMDWDSYTIKGIKE